MEKLKTMVTCMDDIGYAFGKMFDALEDKDKAMEYQLKFEEFMLSLGEMLAYAVITNRRH